MLIFINHDDIRSLELMEELITRGYYVSDQLKDMRYADVIYMGMKGIDNKNRLLMNQETRVIEENTLHHLKPNTIIITLIFNEYLESLSRKHGFRYMALMHDEEFVCQNSLLTAEGLVSYLISHRRFPLYHSRIAVFGFGHCAKPIAKYLKAFDADVTVIVRNNKYQAEIESMGCQYGDINDFDLSSFDIVINTIPQLVVKQKHIDQLDRKAMIVDVASYPYGIDHHYAISQGLNCIILPSIPCKYAYGYAGLLIANKIERELENA